MTPEQIDIIRSTWRRLSGLDSKAIGAAFYDRLFYIAPEVRALFLSSVPEQSKKLVAMLHYMVRNLHRPEEVSAAVSALAGRHVGYNVKPYQYAVVGNALLWTLEKSLGDFWSEEAEEAWAAYYTTLAESMTAAHGSKQTA